MLPSSSLYTIHPNYSADAFSLISRIYILKKKKKRKLSRRRGRAGDGPVLFFMLVQ
jgi:hypothetical protein